MTKDGFKKGLSVFRKLGLKAIPEIRTDAEFQDMFKLWNEILKNPGDGAFYDACKKYAHTERFFPAVSQVKNIIYGRSANNSGYFEPVIDPRTQKILREKDGTNTAE